MPYWLTEIFRRTRNRHRPTPVKRADTPRLRTPEERAQEQAVWEQARQRVQERAAEARQNSRGDTPPEP